MMGQNGRYPHHSPEELNKGNISINRGEDLTGFIRASCFTRVSSKNLSGLPEIMRRYE